MNTEMKAEQKRYRVYTSLKKIGDDYYEAKYEEYDGLDKLRATGTEDFTKERLRAATKCYYVQAYNGRLNRANQRMTDCVGHIRVSKNAVAIRVARMKYENVARVQ